MSKVMAVFAMALALSSCAGLLSANPSTLSSTASGVFGIPAATVAEQMQAEIMQIQQLAQQLQMLRAQLNGTPVVPPPLP